MHYLIVVARNEPALYEHLRDRHGRDPRVRVVVDRRGASDVEITESRPRVERRRRRSWLSTGASHELVELAGEDTTESLSRSQQPSVRHEEAPRPMNEMEILEDPQRVTRWLAEGQQMLDRVIPTLIGERDHLRQTLHATEHECERLRGELGEARRDLGEARRDLGALQSEIEKLRGERVVMAEAFGGAVDLLGQLQRPLNEIARRLHAAQPTQVDTSAA